MGVARKCAKVRKSGAKVVIPGLSRMGQEYSGLMPISWASGSRSGPEVGPERVQKLVHKWCRSRKLVSGPGGVLLPTLLGCTLLYTSLSCTLRVHHRYTTTPPTVTSCPAVSTVRDEDVLGSEALSSLGKSPWWVTLPRVVSVLRASSSGLTTRGRTRTEEDWIAESHIEPYTH